MALYSHKSLEVQEQDPDWTENTTVPTHHQGHQDLDLSSSRPRTLPGCITDASLDDSPFFHFAANLPPVKPGRARLCSGRNCESVNKNPVELNLCIVQTNSDLQGSCSYRMWWLDNNTTNGSLVITNSPSLVAPRTLRTPSDVICCLRFF